MAVEKWSYQGFDLRLENGFGRAEAAPVVDAALARIDDESFVMQRPGHEHLPAEKRPRVHVKIDARRPDQALGKRLRASRPVREGRGLRAFAHAGLPVPDLLLFGEQSRLRPRGASIVVIDRIRAPSADLFYEPTPDLEVGRRVMHALAGVHGRGLVHGDARLASFVPTPERVWILHLSSWGRASNVAVEADLASLLGSAMRLGGDHAHLNQLLLAYLNAPETPAVSLPPEWQRRTLAAAEQNRRRHEQREAARAAGRASPST